MTCDGTTDTTWMRRALHLARRAYGWTSPNPMVGAVLVQGTRMIGQGWHHNAGAPHAEIESLRDATARGYSVKGATLYVTLEPCCTHGRTPPCTDALIAAGLRRVVVAAVDPNPRHAGRGLAKLRAAGMRVETGLLAERATRLNEAFNHWIVHRTPLVTVKAAMTLDGKIATADGESKWITGEEARRHAMRLRLAADAILVGVNTVIADDPSLTVRGPKAKGQRPESKGFMLPAALGAGEVVKPARRLVLDSLARTPLQARLVTDEWATRTTLFVSPRAPARRVAELAKRVSVVVVPTVGPAKLKRRGARAPCVPFAAPRREVPAPTSARESSLPFSDEPAAGQGTFSGLQGDVQSSFQVAPSAINRTHLDIRWILRELGRQEITSLLVEGGGEVNASFLAQRLAHRVAFFYAPKFLGDRQARKAVAGHGAASWPEVLRLRDLVWRRVGPDLFLSARVE